MNEQFKSIETTELVKIANAIRTKVGSNEQITLQDMPDKIRSIEGGGIYLPELESEGSSTDLLAGKQLIDGEGNIVTGTIPIRTNSNLNVNEANVTIPKGYYNTDVVAKVSSTAQATPSVSINSSGLITATATQTAGYVTAGTKSGTKQLTTQAAKTITPNTSSQTAVAKNVYTTGAITVAGDANLKAENIAEGVSIFGITGTHSGGSSGGVSIETCTVTLHDDPYLAIKTTWYYTDVNMTLQQCTGSGEITVPKNTLMAFIYYPDMSYRFYGNNITSILSASIDAENSCEVVQICGDCEIEITPDDAGESGGGSLDPDE